MQQLGDGRLSHIGFYVARADPSASPPRCSQSTTDPSGVGVRRQLTLTRDGFVAKAGFENKKEGTSRHITSNFFVASFVTRGRRDVVSTALRVARIYWY